MQAAMGHMDTHDMLRRLLKATQAPSDDEDMTAGRALRLAMARAAEAALGLSLTVLGVNQQREDLTAALRRPGADALLLGLWRGHALVGIAVIDAQLRAACVEMQTLGQLRPAAAPDRAITASDVALSAPLIDRLLAEIEDASAETELAGWGALVRTGARIADARAAALALPQAEYRCVDLTLDLGTGERQATLMLILPVAAALTEANREADATSARFASRFRATVMDAPAELHAVLHRMKLPLSKVTALTVGQTLALPGVTVSSVRLEGAGGQKIGTAKLGQMAGLRAVRLQIEGLAAMSDARMPQGPGRAPEPAIAPMQAMPALEWDQNSNEEEAGRG